MHVNITHSCFGYNMTPHYVELFKQVLWHDSIDHSHLILYNYKSSSKHSHLKKNRLSDCLFMNTI
jgi:hypothetical protein